MGADSAEEKFPFMAASKIGGVKSELSLTKFTIDEFSFVFPVVEVVA